MNAIGNGLAVLALAALAAGCGLLGRDADGVVEGSGRVVSEARPISGVSAIALEGSGQVTITQGAAEALTVQADDNLLPLIGTAVEGGTLRLGLDPLRASGRQTLRPTQPIRHLVTVRDLSAIDLAGSGEVRAATLQAGDLVLRLPGSGNLTIDHLEADRVDEQLSGSGTITLAGRAARQTITLSGEGEIQAGDLESQQATVTLSGSGQVTLWARDQLDILLSGSGSVSYFGQPTVGRRDITSSGDINPLGEKR